MGWARRRAGRTTLLIELVVDVDDVRWAAFMGALVASAPGEDEVSDVAALVVDDLGVVTHLTQV